MMTENENELLDLIREHKNPEKAFLKVLEFIVLYINHRALFESIFSAALQEFGGTTQA